MIVEAKSLYKNRGTRQRAIEAMHSWQEILKNEEILTGNLPLACGAIITGPAAHGIRPCTSLIRDRSHSQKTPARVRPVKSQEN